MLAPRPKRRYASPRRSIFRERFPRFADDHHVGQARDLVVIVEEAGKDGAFDLGVLVKGCLVGLIAEKDIADGDFVPHLFLEFSDNATFYGLPLFGHNNYVCH